MRIVSLFQTVKTKAAALSIAFAHLHYLPCSRPFIVGNLRENTMPAINSILAVTARHWQLCVSANAANASLFEEVACF